MSRAISTTFRWNIDTRQLVRRVYAEAELEEVGLPSDRRYVLMVYLVRDEMTPRAPFDPENRVGKRVFVGAFRDQEECRLLAHLGSVEAAHRAYTPIYNVIKENPDKVKRFGDDWLVAEVAA